MKELSLHILDIAQNAVVAGATLLEISIREADGLLELEIGDNGRGMDAALLAKVADPFTTTRDTRKVGLGLPLLRLAAEQTGGVMTIASQPGQGTRVTATFHLGHMDCAPLGNINETLLTLLTGNPEMDIVYVYEHDGQREELDTRK
ncbi:MAG: ATP-binding protein [Clostridiales bacterium]|nr:ATP-binding protein [Clostridiales bacterium]